ncbi:MAG TPA: hypothetical protein PKI47_09630 [Fervidobacterium sp.]|nr:hypothetical protein [Fervidobacterium sp.]
MYDIRCNGSGWPDTVEAYVSINYYGTIVLKQKLDLMERGLLEIEGFRVYK